jgi:hypothetical protein
MNVLDRKFSLPYKDTKSEFFFKPGIQKLTERKNISFRGMNFRCCFMCSFFRILFVFGFSPFRPLFSVFRRKFLR